MGHDVALSSNPLLCYAYIYIYIYIYIYNFFLKIRNIGNYQSIYVKVKFPLKDIIFYNTSLLWKEKKKENEMKFSQSSIFFCMWQVHPIWDLTTWKWGISMYTYLYVKLRYIAAQEVPFMEFHIPNFRKVLWQTHLFTFSN